MELFLSAVTWDKALKTGMRQTDLLPIVGRFGLAGLEFRPYWEDEATEAEATGRQLARTGLRSAYACNDVLLAQTAEAAREGLVAIARSLGTASRLGASILRVNLAAGPFDRDLIAAGWWREAVRSLVTAARARGIDVAVENAPDPEKGSEEMLAMVLAAVDIPSFGLTFDTANWLIAGQDPERAARRFGSRVLYTHLKDAIAVDGGFLHSHPGSGAVNVARVVALLGEAGATGPMALEFPGGDDPESRVLAALKYFGRK